MYFCVKVACLVNFGKDTQVGIMEQKRLNIFVSSTSRDLERYRDEVRETILRMEHYPIGMEAFNPTQRNAVQLCYDQVQKADIFIGIYAHRYGYAPANDVTYTAGDKERHCPGDKSITHLEYEWAVERSLPMLLFVLADEDNAGNPVEWPEEFIEPDPGQTRLKQFKSDVMTRHVVGFFNSPDDLSHKVATGLHAVLAELDHDTQSSQKKRRQRMSVIGVATLVTAGIVALFALNGDDNDNSPLNPTGENPAAVADQVDDGSRLVLISDIAGESSSGNFNIARRLEGDLQDRIRERGLENVNVRVHTPTIDDESEALDLLEQENADALIWGWYDDIGVNVSVILPGTGGNPQVLDTGEIPFESDDVEGNRVAIVVRDILPENVTFISLFVIGNLYYSANEYQSGFTAMNAAMDNIPENATLENEALVHYFNARQLQQDESEDIATIVCEYAKALELRPDFAEAYNNLGIVAATFSLGENYTETLAKIDGCLSESGVTTPFDTNSFFEAALEIRPDWSLPRYNMINTYWEYREADSSDVQPELESILEEDATLGGPHVMLGIIAVENDDLALAREYFTTATELMPDLAEVRFNLGQVELLMGNRDEARAHFEAALAIDPETEEAHLALANLALEDGNQEQATEHLDTLSRPGDAPEDFTLYRGYEPFYAGDVLESMSLPDEEAVAILEKNAELLWHSTGFWEDYLLGLLYLRMEQPEAAADKFAEVNNFQYFFESEQNENLVVLRNRQTADVAWTRLAERCYTPEEGVEIPQEGAEIDVADWGNVDNPCLPEELDARIDEVYRFFRDALPYRFYFSDQFVHMGAACPFVFTRNDNTQNWQWDTTILYGIVGAENEHRQIRRLTNFNGELWIREVEPETSYIDLVEIKVVAQDGREYYLQTDVPELQSADDEYLVLDTGDNRHLTFAGHDTITDVAEVWIIAEGYYVPYKTLTD